MHEDDDRVQLQKGKNRTPKERDRTRKESGNASHSYLRGSRTPRFALPPPNQPPPLLSPAKQQNNSEKELAS